MYIKSKKQDASSISSLRDNQGYLHSEAKDEAEILNAQFKYHHRILQCKISQSLIMGYTNC